MKITLVSLWRRCRVGEGVGEEEGVLVSEGSNLQPRSEVSVIGSPRGGENVFVKSQNFSFVQK